MKTYKVSIMGLVSFDEDELIEKFPKFKSLSDKKKDEKVMEHFNDVMCSYTNIESFELFDDEIDVEDDGWDDEDGHVSK